MEYIFLESDPIGEPARTFYVELKRATTKEELENWFDELRRGALPFFEEKQNEGISYVSYSFILNDGKKNLVTSAKNFPLCLPEFEMMMKKAMKSALEDDLEIIPKRLEKQRTYRFSGKFKIELYKESMTTEHLEDEDGIL